MHITRLSTDLVFFLYKLRKSMYRHRLQRVRTRQHAKPCCRCRANRLQICLHLLIDCLVFFGWRNTLLRKHLLRKLCLCISQLRHHLRQFTSINIDIHGEHPYRNTLCHGEPDLL